MVNATLTQLFFVQVSQCKSVSSKKYYIPKKRRFFNRRTLIISLSTLFIIATIAIAILFIPVPRSVTISAGPEGSSFYRHALRYKDSLEKKGIKTTIITSSGSRENLWRIANDKADIGFVQGGINLSKEPDNVVSLGSMFYVPLVIFYRDELIKLADLHDKKVGIGTEYSGTHAIATAILQANSIDTENNDNLLQINGDEAADALLNGELDAIFLSGDSASTQNLIRLMYAPDIKIYSFNRPEAYLKRFRYLSPLNIPAGTFNLAQNLPPEPLVMLAPTVELLAHENFSPALINLLIDAAKETHSRGTILQETGEFPALVQQNWPLSQEALRYHQEGKNFLYRYLPFWLASFIARMLYVLAPLLILALPLIPLIPKLLDWRIESRIYSRYQELAAVEREVLDDMSPERFELLNFWLNEIERSIIDLRIHGAYTEQSYILRQHLRSVRSRLAALAEKEGIQLP